MNRAKESETFTLSLIFMPPAEGGGMEIFMNEQTDKRVIKTKSQLRKSLSSLLQKKKIQNITVTELSEMAEINRGTFYLHYKDIYDLLTSIQHDLLTDFESLLKQIGSSTDNLVPFIESLFAFLYKNRDMSGFYLRDALDAEFSLELRRMLRVCVFNKYNSIVQQQKMPNFELYYDFILSGTLGMLARWADDGFKISPHNLAVLTDSFIRKGLTDIIDD